MPGANPPREDVPAVTAELELEPTLRRFVMASLMFEMATSDARTSASVRAEDWTISSQLLDRRLPVRDMFPFGSCVEALLTAGDGADLSPAALDLVVLTSTSFAAIFLGLPLFLTSPLSLAPDADVELLCAAIDADC
jgi:hypothetical protein